MNKFNKLSAVLAIFLTLSLVLGNFSIVLAEEMRPVEPSEAVVDSTPIVDVAPENTESTPEIIDATPEATEEIAKEIAPTVTPEETTPVETIEGDYVPGEILVKYRKQTDVAVVKVSDATTVEEKISELENNPKVEYVEPNYELTLATLGTDDPSADLLWGLDNTGQIVNGVAGTSDADIDAPGAWAISEGTNADVIVAVIDVGVAYDHPDLSANMWHNPGEIPANGIDDEGDGFVDDVYGYDFADDDSDPYPSIAAYPYDRHGTHIAGIIAASKNNGVGVAGVAPHAKIMALKIGLNVASEEKAIDFAIAHGAKIINASYGGGSYSDIEYNAIKRFQTAGGIFVAAAGNFSSDNDSNDVTVRKFFPASYDLDNIISVAATNSEDNLADFSNYGAISVDVAAPGTSIYSTTSSLAPANLDYGYLSGTSMATPYVAGLVALIEGYQPTLSASEVKNIILNSGDDLASLAGKTVSGKRINAEKALQAATPIIPEPDTTAPVITLLGNAIVEMTAGGIYNDPGATATDNIDGDITANIVVTGLPFDTTAPAEFTISYDVVDAAGNHAVTVTREINIIPVPIVVTPTHRSHKGGGGGGGGGRSRNPVATVAEVDLGCLPGNLFSITTGRPCSTVAINTTPIVGQVLGAETFHFTLNLGLGSSGNEVIELQKFLIAHAYLTGTADGKFGPQTKAAVAKFQTANGLTADGSVGALTRAVLNK